MVCFVSVILAAPPEGEREGATWYFALVFVSVQYLVVASLSVFDESRTEIEIERPS